MNEPQSKPICKFAEAEKKTGLQKFVEGTWTPIVVILTGLAAAVGLLTNQLSGVAEVADGAKSAALDAEARAEEARLLLQQKSIDQDYTIEMAKLVIDSIKADDVESQELLVRLVDTVPDKRVARALAEKLKSSTDPRVREDAKTAVENANEIIRKQSNPYSALLPLKSVQIFWCNFGRYRDENRDLATSIKDVLDGLNERDFVGHRLSSSSIRSINEAIERRLSRSIAATESYVEARADHDSPSELRFVNRVREILAHENLAVGLRQSNSGSETSFSIFVCRK